MNKSDFLKALPFYLFVIGIFLIIISPDFLSDGMFMDGLIYSCIAENISNGICSFWDMKFTETHSPNFYGHPPLAMGIQSIFYSIFGDSRYIDKLYSFSTYAIVAIIIIQIWKRLGYKQGWSVLLLWASIPLIAWASTNNLLENTLSVFIVLSIYFYLLSQGDKRKYLWVVLSGIMLCFGFLVKGFVAFFPLVFPLIYWLILRKTSFKNAFIDTIVIVLSSLIPLIVLVILSPDAKVFLVNYLDKQVVNSLQNVSTVNSRFWIVMKVFLDLLPAVVISLLFLLWARIKRIPFQSLKPDYRLALVFFLLALCGVLPIMVSAKQRLMYIISTTPFFAISIGILINPLIEKIYECLKSSKIFKWIGYSIFLAGVILTFSFANKIGRDKEKINDTYTLGEYIPKGSIISIAPSIKEDWSLHGYLYRYFNISLDWVNSNHEFLLVGKTDKKLPEGYVPVDIETKEFKLLKKIDLVSN